MLNAMHSSPTTKTLLANEKSNSKLFRINLQMRGNKLEYDPSLDENADKSFMQTIKNLIDDICTVTSQVKKIAQPVNVDPAAPDSAITYQSKSMDHVPHLRTFPGKQRTNERRVYLFFSRCLWSSR